MSDKFEPTDKAAHPEAGEFASARVPSADDHYGPTIIEPIPPRKRDFWRVLRGRYEGKVRVRRSLTMKGFSRVLKVTWTGDRILRQLNEASPLARLTTRKAGE